MTMCIGMKPVVLPPRSCSSRNASDGGFDNASIVGESSSSSSSAITTSDGNVAVPSTTPSGKRPLHVDETVLGTEAVSTQPPLASMSPPKKSRKTRRYSTCSQSCVTAKRRVRFGGIDAIVPPAHSISEEDAKRLWYDLEECADMNEASKVCVRDQREHNKDALRHVLCVSTQCSHSPPPFAYLQVVRLNLPPESRGLELGLLPVWVRQRRMEHVRRVVDVQNQIQAGKTPLKNDEQTMAKALVIQSIRSSQASQLFAQLLARNVAQDEMQQATDGIAAA